MPLTTRRGSWLGRPVRGFSGGSSGSSRCHCASVTSKRLISPTWTGLPQSATLCRHALGDGTTTTLKRILISTYDGDFAALTALIEAAEADESVRAAALGP